jgi:hypothetical protein
VPAVHAIHTADPAWETFTKSVKDRMEERMNLRLNKDEKTRKDEGE